MSKYMSASCLMFLPRADKETVITINNRVLSSLENCFPKKVQKFSNHSVTKEVRMNIIFYPVLIFEVKFRLKNYFSDQSRLIVKLVRDSTEKSYFHVLII